MNLLSLTGALITASASVLNQPIKENHQNKMMDVEYKYQSNVVNSADDLIIGNIYRITIDDSWDNYFTDLEELNLTLIKVYEYDFENSEIEIDDILRTGDINTDVTTKLIYDYGSMYINTYLSEEYFDSLTFVEDMRSIVFELDAIVLLNNYSFTTMDNQLFYYTDYNEIIPSTSHRGNLYATIYDFFYGIFDTSDTNELSMTIMGQNMNLTSWLAHTVTIALLLLGVLWLILVIRWIFRVFSGLVKI